MTKPSVFLAFNEGSYGGKAGLSKKLSYCDYVYSPLAYRHIRMTLFCNTLSFLSNSISHVMVSVAYIRQGRMYVLKVFRLLIIEHFLSVG